MYVLYWAVAVCIVSRKVSFADRGKSEHVPILFTAGDYMLSAVSNWG